MYGWKRKCIDTRKFLCQIQPLTQLAREVPGTSLGHKQKDWWFNERSVFFLDAIALVLHIYYWKNKYSKVLNGDVTQLQEVPRTKLQDVPGTKWWDVLGTSARRRSYIFFNSTQKHIKLTLTGYSRLFSDL